MSSGQEVDGRRFAEPAHTPGPWAVQVDQDGEVVVWTRQSHIGTLATVHADDINGSWPVEANARLIAAAPDLLQHLEAMVAHYVQLAGSGDCGLWDPENEVEVTAARAAIARATGTAS
jgi:hypothetical protein